MRALIALVVLAGIAAAAPEADVISYQVKPKDDLAVLAAELYGDRNDAILIMAANTMPQGTLS